MLCYLNPNLVQHLVLHFNILSYINNLINRTLNINIFLYINMVIISVVIFCQQFYILISYQPVLNLFHLQYQEYHLCVRNIIILY